MARFIQEMKDLVIPINTPNSNGVGPLGDATAITIAGPAALTGALNIQGSYDNATFYNVKSAGSNIAVAVDGLVTVTDIAFDYVRVHSDQNEAAARTLKLRKQWET